MKRVLLISIAIFISIPILILALAGGQGKSGGNSCMSQCTEANAEFHDTSNELTQFCQAECNAGTGQGSCLTTEDDCCVLYTNDPDCIVYPECISDKDCNAGGNDSKGSSGGESCLLPDGLCDVPDLIGTCITQPEVCTLAINEVCGCNGVTYTNDCFRLFDAEQLDHVGMCAGSGGK